MIGKTVSQYRILRQLADVDDAYSAEDVDLGRHVILKFLPSDWTDDPELLRSFGRTARALVEQSPQSMLVGIENHDGRRFLVLETPHADKIVADLRELEIRTIALRAARVDETTSAVSTPSSGSQPDSRAQAQLQASTEQTTAQAQRTHGTFSPGQILGDRYRIVSQVGRGGMGEVWQAFDLKLQMEVALKSLRTERFSGEAALELLRREVRAARGVISPNVCRIFDLVVEDGQELVSMEYIDGQTVADILQQRSPLEIREAQAIAAQLLAGLEAIHGAGLVHRDIKPENIMITRSGRVVVMDFGIAKGVTEDQSSTVSGTPAYMAPEQMSGEALDGRADLFAAGVLLAEMTSAAGVRDRSHREQVLKGVRETPPRLPEGPWRTVLERAVSADRERRYGSASALARALEEVTLRVEGAEDRNPYPGLASFTTDDAEYFYGREAEVEAVWKKLQRANLLAIIGASGAGKTSFIQAGVISALPEGWSFALCHPGAAPFVALGEALAGRLAGDFDALRQLLRFDEPDIAVSMFSRWRQRHAGALLIVDQFEELFTQNPTEVQLRFTELLGQVANQADAHVLLCMRDDFFMRCHEFPALEPVFSELTPLGPPTGAALRRALVQPALSCGYRFESENFIEEMLSQVGEERGALPLLAFTVSRLWERRDREKGSLTRAAYESIGGVSGALARHAEATLERIGTSRQPLVREVFRNLITGEGTRISIEMEKLFSVFKEGEVAMAREVLRELIDARLLTTFERQRPSVEETRPERHVEIVHESLLTAWPRLVRWRTQEADSAQLRDQLRQGAQLWQERSRSDDMLWTGTAFREFEVWRDRYPGRLTETEEAFAGAMVERAERQRRRRRRFTTTAFVFLLATVVAIGTLWRRAEVQRLGAEAARLHSLGQLELTKFPSKALAYAIASLELRDDPEVRRFALEALWKGPTALVFRRAGTSTTVDFSPDGRNLVNGDNNRASIDIWASGATAPITLRDTTRKAIYGAGYPRFGASSALVAGFWQPNESAEAGPGGSMSLWSLEDRSVASTLSFDRVTLAYLSPFRRHLMAFTQETPGNAKLRVWDVEEDVDPNMVGALSVRLPGKVASKSWTTSLSAVDPTGTWLTYAEGRDLKVVELSEMENERPQRIGRHESDIEAVVFHPDGERIVTLSNREVWMWSRISPDSRPLHLMTVRRGLFGLHVDAGGTWIAVPHADGGTQLRNLEDPPDVEPLELRWNQRQVEGVAFHPGGNWIVTASAQPTFWPLRSSYPRELRRNVTHPVLPVFAPDGSCLASVAGDSIQLWSLSPGVPNRTIPSGSRATFKWGILFDPLMRFVLFQDADGLRKISLDDGRIEELPFEYAWSAAIDPSGRYVAVGYWDEPGTEGRTDVLDLETGEMQELKLGEGRVNDLEFTPDGQLMSAIGNKLVRWNLHDGSHEVLMENVRRFDLSRDGHRLLTNEGLRAVFYDLQNDVKRVLTSHGSGVCAVALDATGTLAITGDRRGDVRVGPVTGEEPHLMVGHKGPVYTTPSTTFLAVDPLGRWIASAAEEDEARVLLWPMPQGEPIGGLPREQFLARLRALTNIRVIPNEEEPTGYEIDFAEFPGWEAVPSW